MLNKYRSWCQKWGQLWGFGTIISYLVGFTIIFEIEMQTNSYYVLAWLVQFIALSALWIYTMKKMGWRLPKEVKKTHSW